MSCRFHALHFPVMLSPSTSLRTGSAKHLWLFPDTLWNKWPEILLPRLRDQNDKVPTMSKVIVVGAGINGVTAAIELQKRGHGVILVDPGPLPHPLAASTDISKAVRAAYGADEDYTELAERSIKRWRKWNQELGAELYHEIGFLFVRQRAMQPGDFEYESFELLKKRGHKVERIDSARLREKFPAWNAEHYPDGFLDLEAGYAESGRVVAALVERARSLGIE